MHERIYIHNHIGLIIFRFIKVPLKLKSHCKPEDYQTRGLIEFYSMNELLSYQILNMQNSPGKSGLTGRQCFSLFNCPDKRCACGWTSKTGWLDTFWDFLNIFEPASKFSRIPDGPANPYPVLYKLMTVNHRKAKAPDFEKKPENKSFMKSKYYILLPVILLSAMLNAQPMHNRKADGYKGIWFELNQKYEYGDKYSGGLGTYTAHHFPMAIYAPQVDKTFFVYGGTTGEKEKHLLCMAGVYDHKTGKVSKPVVVYDKQGVDDPHDNPSLMIDPDGYLWVFVSGRNVRRMGFKMKSTQPWSIDSFQEITSEEMTYPQPWPVEGGILHLFTKYTGVRELYFESSSDGHSWTGDQKLAGIREPGHNRGGHYQISQRRGNLVGTFFNRHPDGNVDIRTDLYYMQTSDMGKTWTTVDRQPVPIPVEKVESPTRVVNYQSQGLNVYICDMNFDAKGNPACIYVTSRGHEPGPGNAPYEWRLTRWDGQQWITTVIGTSDHNYDMGSLFIDGSNWTVVAPLINEPQKWGVGGEIVILNSADNGNTWKESKQITRGSERNHGYVRRVINGKAPFHFMWADGHPHEFSISKLYIGDLKGKVWELPYTMVKDWEKPARLKKR